LGEFGLTRATGASRFLKELPVLLEQQRENVPPRVRILVGSAYEEIRSIEERIRLVEDQLAGMLQEEPTIEALRQIPGVGLLTATAVYASVGNTPSGVAGIWRAGSASPRASPPAAAAGASAGSANRGIPICGC